MATNVNFYQRAYNIVYDVNGHPTILDGYKMPLDGGIQGEHNATYCMFDLSKMISKIGNHLENWFFYVHCDPIQNRDPTYQVTVNSDNIIVFGIPQLISCNNQVAINVIAKHIVNNECVAAWVGQPITLSFSSIASWSNSKYFNTSISADHIIKNIKYANYSIDTNSWTLSADEDDEIKTSNVIATYGDIDVNKLIFKGWSDDPSKYYYFYFTTAVYRNNVTIDTAESSDQHITHPWIPNKAITASDEKITSFQIGFISSTENLVTTEDEQDIVNILKYADTTSAYIDKQIFISKPLTLQIIKSCSHGSTFDDDPIIINNIINSIDMGNNEV